MCGRERRKERRERPVYSEKEKEIKKEREAKKEREKEREREIRGCQVACKIFHSERTSRDLTKYKEFPIN